MGGEAPRSLCLGGELLIPLRGAIVRSPTVDQQQTPLGANTLYLNSLLNGLPYYLRLQSPPPSSGGPPCTGPPRWTILIPPLTSGTTFCSKWYEAKRKKCKRLGRKYVTKWPQPFMFQYPAFPEKPACIPDTLFLLLLKDVKS
jgi:hypothetical protein